MKTIETKKTAGLKVTSSVKAGGFGGGNHSRTMKTIEIKKTAGLKVKSSVRAGGFGGGNHSRTLLS